MEKEKQNNLKYSCVDITPLLFHLTFFFFTLLYAFNNNNDYNKKKTTNEETLHTLY